MGIEQTIEAFCDFCPDNRLEFWCSKASFIKDLREDGWKVKQLEKGTNMYEVKCPGCVKYPGSG